MKIVALSVVAVLVTALIVFTQPESGRPPTSLTPGSPPARVSSVFYVTPPDRVNGNLCPEVMTHAECKERLGE